MGGGRDRVLILTSQTALLPLSLLALPPLSLAVVLAPLSLGVLAALEPLLSGDVPLGALSQLPLAPAPPLSPPPPWWPPGERPGLSSSRDLATARE